MICQDWDQNFIESFGDLWAVTTNISINTPLSTWIVISSLSSDNHYDILLEIQALLLIDPETYPPPLTYTLGSDVTFSS